MRAEDFRLRNLVTDKSGNIFYISSLSLDIDDEYNELIGATPLGQTSNEILKEVRELYWQPIPLTEEWLKSFGFKVQEIMDADGYTKTKHFYIRNFQVEFWDNSVWGENVFVYNEAQTILVSHVHSLQNLYHCLIGEDLKLN